MLTCLLLLAAISNGAVTSRANAGGARPECMGRKATIVGTKKSDNIEGTPHVDVIVARGGSDNVHGRGGDDVICMGAGGDCFFDEEEGGWLASHEFGFGDDGNDIIDGRRGFDELDGGDGRDILLARRSPRSRCEGYEVLSGGNGADLLKGGDGVDWLFAGPGDDTLEGGGADDWLAGWSGDDLFDGGNGTDLGLLNEGAQELSIDLQRGYARGSGRDRIVSVENINAHHAPTTLIGNDKKNVFYLGPHNDLVRAGGGNDLVSSGPGKDDIYGGAGRDFLDGSDGRDLLDGGASNDVCKNGEVLRSCP